MGCRGLPGCSIIRASLTVALMVSLPRCGSLWAFGPSAHRAHASLRALPGFGADSRSLNRRGGRWPRPPLVSLPRKYRRSARWPRAALVFAHAFRSLWPLRGQVPTGHTLPFGAPSGRFGPFGPKCPGCSIIRASLTVARMVSLPRFGSLCHLRWQQPTGLALPFAPQGTHFPPVPGGRGVCANGANIS